MNNNNNKQALDKFLKNYNKINKVLLIKSPTINYGNIEIQRHKESGYMTYQPIEITTLAATVRQQLPDVELKLFDAEYITLKKMFYTPNKDNILTDCIKEVVDEFKPDLVGISVVFSVAIENGFKIMEIVKSINKKIIVVFGGVHCTFDFERIMKKGADALFLKEADQTFPAFIKYARGESDFDASIHGFTYKSGKGFKKIEYTDPPDFENLPMPAWDLVDTGNYHTVSKLGVQKNVLNDIAPTAIVQTLRGCVARCTFCSVRNFNGLGIRARTTKDVVDEIELLVKDYGVKYLEVVDDDFTADLKRAIAICKEITKRKLDITWSLDNGIRLLTISEELAENLVASGCRMISVGVESGNKEILHKIKKPLTLPGLYKKMEMMNKYPEIYIKGNFIVGFPFESYEQLQDTYKVAFDIDFDWCIFSIYSPLVGTEAMNQFDSETQEKLRFNESNFGSIEFLPDGFESIDHFNNQVFLNNLKCNFTFNPNLLGNRFGIKRAIRDFTRIVEGVDKNHALAMYYLSKCEDIIGSDKAESYRKKYLEILNESSKWSFFLAKLDIIEDDNSSKVYRSSEFKAGREM